MRRLLSVVLAVVAFRAFAFAQQGTVQTLTIHSPALCGNLLGDPADQQYAVYLPAGHDSGNARYPVIYLLHGIADQFAVWIDHFKVPQMLDRLIASHRMPAVIVVMPIARIS